MSIIFLRMIGPIDILSYALGLFSKIKTRDYMVATVIGLTPMAFALAYVGSVSFYQQVIIATAAGIIFLAGWIIAILLRKPK
jgi:uncharacterized membrane protein YdjX (TVP38/TMEM64 family)